MNVKYPSGEKIIEFNSFAIKLIKVKKADAVEVLSHAKIAEAIEDCKKTVGDVYDKAVVLLRGIIQKHPFASGNRRTAFITLKYFLSENEKSMGIKDEEKQAKVLQGIRENYYTDDEIKEWIQHGKIKDFKR